VVEDTVRHFGRLDVLVNTAAFQQHQEQLADLDDDQLEQTFQTNILSFFRVTIHTFTKSLAQNLVPRGIRVNCVAPGPVWTPLNPSDKPPARVATFGADTPLERPAQPEEIAPAYVFFASNADSSYITGEVLTLLGGGTTAA
jgi:NAD(P)-dependent dehydrogenase (short-subunit alcohol dehydrogenase family)